MLGDFKTDARTRFGTETPLSAYAMPGTDQAYGAPLCSYAPATQSPALTWPMAHRYQPTHLVRGVRY
eukprot:3319498-Rhodomonas_salina.1